MRWMACVNEKGVKIPKSIKMLVHEAPSDHLSVSQERSWLA